MSSEEPATGRDGREQDLGGRQPLPEWNPAPKEEPKVYDSGGIESAREAGNDLTSERGPTEDPIVKIVDKRQHEDDRRFYTSAREAAHDLSTYHQVEDTTQAAENLNELAKEVDIARAQVSGRPDAVQEASPGTDVPPAQPDASQPQPEAGEQPSTGIDPDFAALLEKKPQLRAQLEAPFQQAETARQQYVGATQQIANMLVAELAADLPEIVALPPEQRGIGLQILQRQQPERFAAFEAKAARIQGVVNAQQQNAAIEAQQNHQRYTQWGAQQDQAFENANRNESKETLRAAGEEIINFAIEHGISKEALGQLYHTQPILRSSVFQQMMLDSAKYRIAQRSARTNPVHPLPSVQRPGIAPSAGERSAVDLSELRSQFKRASGNEQLRLGAKLMRLQRGG